MTQNLPHIGSAIVISKLLRESNLQIFGTDFCFRKRANAAPPPDRCQSLAVLTAYLRRCFIENAKQHRAVIIDQFDEPGLGDETAKLDELACPLASFHHPSSSVVTGDPHLSPMPHHLDFL